MSDGWLVGSDGFESEGTFAHVSDSGVVTEMEASEPGVPFGHASIRGIVSTRLKYFAFGFEILKVGDAGTLFEVSRSREGRWSAKRVAVLPSAPWSHAIGPNGQLLLSDGPNDYAVIDNRIVPLKCEKMRPGSFFDR